MGEEIGKKRRRNNNRNRHDRNKFRRTVNSTQHRKDLGYGLQGILISCTPRHENHAFREAVLMLEKYFDSTPTGDSNDVSVAPHETESKTENSKTEQDHKSKEDTEDGGEDLSKALQAELKDIRDPKQRLFTRVDGGVNGCIFLRINRPEVDRENVVERTLKDARASGTPNSRHCIRIMPIHNTCYAKPEDAAKASVEVVKKFFPPIVSDDKPVTYAISFRSRLNTNAHREDFIRVIAKGIEECEPRYKVNLTSPDVTLIIEVMKTSCCIGTFRHFYQLAKMNLREAACPSKPKGETQGAKSNPNESAKADTNTNTASNGSEGATGVNDGVANVDSADKAEKASKDVAIRESKQTEDLPSPVAPGDNDAKDEASSVAGDKGTCEAEALANEAEKDPATEITSPEDLKHSSSLEESKT